MIKLLEVIELDEMIKFYAMIRLRNGWSTWGSFSLDVVYRLSLCTTSST